MKNAPVIFLDELNATLPDFLVVVPYEGSVYADFELVIKETPYLTPLHFNPSDDFVWLIKTMGKRFFKDKAEFSDSKAHFWFG